MSRWGERDEREQEGVGVADGLVAKRRMNPGRGRPSNNRQIQVSAPIAENLFCCESVASTSGRLNGPR